jgi:hypothetical protein
MSERATVEADSGVDWRQTADGVRLYDPDDPDAWVEVSFEAGVAPERRLFSVCPDCGFVAPQRTPPGRGMVCGECGTEVTCE